MNNATSVTIRGKTAIRITLGGGLLYEKGAWWKEYGDQLPYIESTGTQSIITDFLPSDKYSVELGILEYKAGTDSSLFGSQMSVSSGYGGVLYQDGNSTYIGTSSALPLFSLTAGQDYELKFDVNNNQVSGFTNGTEVSRSYSGTAENNVPLALFGNNDKDSGVIQQTSQKYTYVTLKSDTGAKEYIPIRVRKEFTDANGVLHEVGSVIMVNTLMDLDVPTHNGVFEPSLDLANFKTADDFFILTKDDFMFNVQDDTTGVVVGYGSGDITIGYGPDDTEIEYTN